MSKAPNPKLFMALTAVALAAGAGLVFMQYSAYSEMTGKVANLRGQVKDAKEVESELAASETRLKETQEKLRHLEQSVPDFAYVPTLLAELEATGRDHGIEVTGVRPMIRPAAAPKADGGKAERKPYEELDIEVKGRGSYGDVMRFVAALQKFPKIVESRVMTLTPKTDLTGVATKLDVSIELRAYMFPQPVEAKPAVQASRDGGSPREG